MKNYLFLNLIVYMPKKPKIIKHVTREELEDMYKREKNSRVKERLLAILHLYEEKNIPEVSKIIKRSESSIKRWLKKWNKEGYDGLIPELKGGPKPKLPDSEWDKILKEIEGKGMNKGCRGLHKDNKRCRILIQHGMACTEEEKESKIW